jgi:hypothetical protein
MSIDGWLSFMTIAPVGQAEMQRLQFSGHLASLIKGRPMNLSGNFGGAPSGYLKV